MINNDIYRRDMQSICDMPLPWDKLDGHSIMITGAAGLIGSFLTDTLMYRNRVMGAAIDVYVLELRASAAESRFPSYIGDEHFHIVEQSVTDPIALDGRIDYIIHAASPADPASFVKSPVETMKANFIGTDNILSFARDCGSTRVLYISSGEFYGQYDGESDSFREDYCGTVDYHSFRSCYPSSKRASEVLCQSYRHEYGVGSVILRPCHVYGAGFTERDSRAIQQFIRSVLAGEDIVMKSRGEQVRSICYISDCASALLYVLLCGEDGEAYNLASPDSIHSIREMAEIIAREGGRCVTFEIPDEAEKSGFNKVTRSVLSHEKLCSLGWKPLTNFPDGIRKTLDILK
ncbi:MAG: NAD-dependent epimerase/dehydratase family protein [Clostridia bacterium]|nr:NAD-dependent epimerase/dehydratase family protein [Clostridia bacterium]